VAVCGKGLPVVKTANWMNHVEFDWQSPVWSPLLTRLGAQFRLIRYDERGTGLSDWDVAELSFETFVRDLEGWPTRLIFDASRFSATPRAPPSRSSTRCVIPSACRGSCSPEAMRKAGARGETRLKSRGAGLCSSSFGSAGGGTTLPSGRSLPRS